MEYVLVKARGLNSRPSVASKVNTGTKLTVITNSEKKMLGPTSCIASTMASMRGLGLPSSSQTSSFLWMFSIRMMLASTIAPMATAMPPRLMMLMVSPW